MAIAPLFAALVLASACMQGSHAAAAIGKPAEQPRRRLAASAPSALTITAGASPSGKTPSIIGVNLGHRYPGSNWGAWMRRLAATSSRAFLASILGKDLQSFVGGADAWGKALDGTPVTSAAAFSAAATALRQPAGHDPAQASSFANPVNWGSLDSRWLKVFNSSAGTAQEGSHDATLAELAGIQAVRPLVVISLKQSAVAGGDTVDVGSAAYWQARWETYKHFYAFCRYLYLRNITSIELYNEPDLDDSFTNADGSYSAALWIDIMAVRSRAIQDLYSDMNKETGGSLTPDIHVGAFAKTTYNNGKLGQPTVQAMHKTFAAAADPDPAWSNFKTYSYHSYGQTGKAILNNFKELNANTSDDRAAFGAFKFAVTEHNAKTSGDYSTDSVNTDMQSESGKLASQVISLATAGGDGLSAIYTFKFSITQSDNNGVTKNGIHWGDNTAAPFNIGDSTLAAEALRLAAEHLTGSKDLLSLTFSTKMSDVKTAGVKDGAFYYIYLVNTGDSDVEATFQLSALGVGAGWPVVVDRVNASSYGEATELLETGASGEVVAAAYVDNLIRLKVPAAAPSSFKSVPAALATNIRAGPPKKPGKPKPSFCVGTTTSKNQANTYAGVLQFKVDSSSTVSSAVLKLTVATLTGTLSAPMPMLLFAAPGSSAWVASAPTWAALSAAGGPLLPLPPVGAPKGYVVNSVAANFLNWDAPGAAVAGHVTLAEGLSKSTAAGAIKMVDLTDLVRSSSDGTINLVLVRPYRNNQEKATGDTMAEDTLNGGARACFWSQAATVEANRPQLLLQYA